LCRCFSDIPGAVPAPSPALVDRFAAIVGPANALRTSEAVGPYLIEPRGRFPGRTPLVLRPGSVGEVAAILKLANETRTGIVPQGGNTGLVGAQIPSERGDEIVLSLSRLNRIRAIDRDGNTLTAEAGVILADAQAAADAAGRRLPLSLASEGSAEIGGNLATNAGGTAVLAYGNARQLALGLEVVLASGEVWDGLRGLRKDNTGYALRDLFIGSEGTLGVITAAVLKLVPRPKGTSVAVLGVPTSDAAVGVLRLALAEAGAGLTACEIIARIGVETAVQHVPGTRDPLAQPHPWYVLLEVSSGRSQGDADGTLDAIFEAAVHADLARDGVRALSLDQAKAFWHLREALSDVQKQEGASIKHDVAVPVAAIPAFLERATAAALKTVPGARPFPFGHLGDGNIHFNVSQPPGTSAAAFLAQSEAVNAAVYDVVLSLGGTISAEHGIGRAKRELLVRVKSPVEIALMRRLKAALDPNGILNPGKVL
jgi:FAD/FMN-containing dehydrogenase